MSKDKKKDDVIMNEMITVKEVRCTSDEGTNYGIISKADAMKLAIAMARLGGIGIVHKNMDISSQVMQIKKVKKSESGIIIDPVLVKPTQTLDDAQNLMSEYKISGVPVVDDENNLS